MAQTTITFTHERASDFKARATDAPRVVLAQVTNLVQGIAGGGYQATEMTVSQDPASATVELLDVGGAMASGSITFSGSSGAWTATVNGVGFAGTSAGDDDAEGDDLATAISASANVAIAGVLTARNEVGVVVIEAVAKGTAGNAITLAVTGTGLTRSAATLTGGLQGSVTVTVNGTSEATNTTNLTDAAAAALVASEVNANAIQSALVTATSSGDVVTLEAVAAGVSGNAITLTSTSATGTATASGAKLSGGTSTTYTL